MDRLMAAPVVTPTRDDDVAPAASASLVGGRLPDAPGPKAAPDDEMALMMGLGAAASRAKDKATSDGEGSEAAAQTESEDAVDADAPASERELADAASKDAADSKDAASDSDDGGTEDAAGSTDTAAGDVAASEDAEESEPEPPIVLHPERMPSEPTAAASAEDAGGGRWLWLVGAAAAVGIGVAAMGGPGSSSTPDATSTKAAVAPLAAAPSVAAPVEPKPPVEPALATTKPPLAEDAPPPVVPEPPAADPSRDPREPPPGTPPDIAAVFKKIPVSPADRAPVGGVGKTGVHVDDVAMGNGYARSRCTGDGESFSVGNDGLANVCIRVVHQRQKEDLTVIWQKHEGNARRGKIVVKPAHAYRTRAYLKLRSEYVGDWTVKIMSADGVELAAHDFSIAP